VAAQGQHGRGGAKSGQGKGSAEQCAVYRVQSNLGKVLRVPIGLESRRRHGLGRACPAAAAGARISAS
jgi:hypothetical protein